MRLQISYSIFDKIEEARQLHKQLFAVLIDPEEQKPYEIGGFLNNLPDFTTHIFVGGSTASRTQTASCISQLKACTNLPLVLFPGNHTQVVPDADALLFLSLLSGRNPDFLIGEQIKAVPFLKNNSAEVIPTAYILISESTTSSVARVSNTIPLKPDAIEHLVHTALAGQYAGKKLIYLEAGSGAAFPVSCEAIAAVTEAVSIPVIVGGGIKNAAQMEAIYKAGATMIVVGTALEQGIF